MGEIILGAILIIVTAVLAEEAPPKWRRWLWGLFVVLVIAQAAIQIRSRRIERASAEKGEKAQQDLKNELDQSLLTQQYTKGQLDSLALTIGRLSQPNPQGDALAAAIRQMAQATAQNAADLKASNADLCKRARATAEDIRLFQEKYDNSTRLSDDQTWTRARQAKTEQEARDIFANGDRARMDGIQAHEAEFRSKYMGTAKSLRDLLMGRLPPQTADLLIRNNGQAEGNLTFTSFAGSRNEYGIANYLDVLADSVCPQTPEQQKTKQARNHAIAVRLHAFSSLGNKFDERCRPTSKNPPKPSEVTEWIAKASAYVRSSTLEEHLKDDFEKQDPLLNGTFAGKAPGCEKLEGPILYYTSKIEGLAVYLERQ